MGTRLRLASLVAIALILINSASAMTYYISVSTGADTNTSVQAQSKSTPWAHLPGMRNASSNVSAYTPVAGDTFVLKGCDDWPNASFPVNWQWSGTSGSHITIGVDQTWFNATNCPSSWNRPQWDAGSAIINPPECTNNNAFLQVNATSNVDFNWIELVNYFWTSAQAGGSCFSHEFWVSSSATASHITLNNFYVHKWTVQNGADDIDHGFMTGCNDGTCVVDRLVADNTDGSVHTGIGMQWATTHSIFKNVSNAIKPNKGGEFAYNDISSVNAPSNPPISTSVHPNCIESIGAGGTATFYIHDNRVHDNTECEGLQVGNPGETDYVWNNLWYNMTTTGANGPNIPQSCSTGVAALYYWNNTNVDQRTVCASFSGCAGTNWTTAFVMQNNHCITNGTPSGSAQSGGMLSGGNISGATTITFSNNVVESATTANANGYTNAETFVYSPASGAKETVGAGTNLTSSWPGGFSTADTTYACDEETINGVVQSVCPDRVSNSRPSAGAWDVGAYEFTNALIPPPAPWIFADAPAPVPAVPFIAEMRPPY